MSRTADYAAITRIEPYRSEPPAGKAIAVIVMIAGAVGLAAWAGHAAVQPSGSLAACAPAGPVSSAQLAAAGLRIRFADEAMREAGSGGSLYAGAKVAVADPVAMQASAEALRAANADMAWLCAEARFGR